MTHKKRPLTIAVFFFAILLYCAYWYGATIILKNSFQSWVVQEMQANNAVITIKSIKRSGFPFSIGLNIEGITLLHSGEKIVVQIPELSLNVSPLNFKNIRYTTYGISHIESQKNKATTHMAINDIMGLMITPLFKRDTNLRIKTKDITLTHSDKPAIVIDQTDIHLNISQPLPRKISKASMAQWQKNGGLVTIIQSGFYTQTSNIIFDGEGALNSETQQPILNGSVKINNPHALLSAAEKRNITAKKNIHLIKNLMTMFEKTFPNPDGQGLKLPASIKAGYLSVGPFPILRAIPEIDWDSYQ